jgi:hypothetical protein
MMHVQKHSWGLHLDGRFQLGSITAGRRPRRRARHPASNQPAAPGDGRRRVVPLSTFQGGRTPRARLGQLWQAARGSARRARPEWLPIPAEQLLRKRRCTRASTARLAARSAFEPVVAGAGWRLAVGARVGPYEVTEALQEGAGGQIFAVRLGLGRIATLYCRPSTLYQIR